MKALFLTLALFVVGEVSAEDSLMESVTNACEADLGRYCSQVTPGEGRLLYCVAAHGDKITSECQYALFRAATVLAELSDALLDVADNCETEIDTLCADVKLGERRILSCLEEHENALGESCRTAVAAMAVD